MAVRFRSRALRATFFNRTVAELTTRGWITAPINFGADPISCIDYEPQERNEIITTNTVAVSLGDVVDDTDEELGALVGGLRSAFYPVFLDVYMATQAEADAVCDDLRDAYDGHMFWLVDPVTGLDSNQAIEIEEIFGPDKPAGGAAINQFQQFWRVMRIGARLYYQT